MYQMAKPSPFRFFFPCPWILKCTCISQSFRLQDWKQTVKTMPLRHSQHSHSLHLLQQIGSKQWSPLSKDSFKGSIERFSVTLKRHPLKSKNGTSFKHSPRMSKGHPRRLFYRPSEVSYGLKKTLNLCNRTTDIISSLFLEEVISMEI